MASWMPNIEGTMFDNPEVFRRLVGVEDSNAASGEFGPLGKESGVPGGDSGLLADAELSMGVAGAFSGGSGLFVD
nr:hypothetical protein Itr_chr14CG07970 [Ipomoea trifida]